MAEKENPMLEQLRADIASGKYTVQDAINNLGSDEELFIAATGVRRSELMLMRPKDILLAENGECIVLIHGHSGETRVVRTESADVRRIVRAAEASGREFIFGQNLNKHINFHTMRCLFATAVYLERARPVKDLTDTERIRCQVRGQKMVLDRSALMYTAYSLGFIRCNRAACYLLPDPSNPGYLVKK